jgi:DNA-binding Lrp family transcriptional regulator
VIRSLDKRNEKILNAIADNARLSYNQLARLTKIPKDSVRTRVGWLKNNLFIMSYFSLINYRRTGLELFYVYLRLRSTKDLEKRLDRKFSREKSVVSVIKVLGRFDLEVKVVARSKKEALTKISKAFPESTIGKMVVLKSERLRHYTMSLNGGQKPFSDYQTAKLKLVLLDLKLIELLSKDARSRVVDLAKDLNVDEALVRQRIKSLLREEVLLGFYARTNKHRCGLHTYIMLISLKEGLGKKDLSNLIALGNIFYVKECAGQYDCIIRFHSKDNKGLISTLTEAREIFGSSLEKFEVCTLLERTKFAPFWNQR